MAVAESLGLVWVEGQVGDEVALLGADHFEVDDGVHELFEQRVAVGCEGRSGAAALGDGVPDADDVCLAGDVCGLGWAGWERAEDGGNQECECEKCGKGFCRIHGASLGFGYKESMTLKRGGVKMCGGCVALR